MADTQDTTREKIKSASSIARRLQNDIESATSKAVHSGLSFVQIARILVHNTKRIMEMIEIAQRMDREELAKSRKRKAPR